MRKKGTREKATGIECCNCTVLRGASRRVSQFYDHHLALIGLRVTQFVILQLLSLSDGCSINELAERLDLDRTTAGKNLRPLEGAGLVCIQAADSDARVRRITLTECGEDKLQEARVIWRRAQSEFESANGPDNAAAL